MNLRQSLTLFAAVAVFGTATAGIRKIDLSASTEPYNKQDMTPFIRTLLEKHVGEQGLKLSFPKGIYHFHPEHATGKYHHATNHDNGYRRFAFPITGFRNIEIDGNGSEFIFHGKIIPFLIEDSHHVTLRNFTVDWQVPFTIEGQITAIDPERSTVEIEVPEEFPCVLENGKLIMRAEGWEERVLGENIVFDPKTGATAYRSDDYYIPKPDNFDIPAIETGARKYLLQTRFTRALPPVGNILTFKGLFTHNRHSPAIHATASSNLLIEDVTVHHCGGMGLLAEKTENVTVRRMQVALRKGTPRMITTTADATHFCNCRGRVLIEECLFENMLDDATNVHGTYVRVTQIEAPDRIIVRLNHPQQAGYQFTAQGDTINVIDPLTLLSKNTLMVKNTAWINEQYLRITFDTPIANKLTVGDGLENMTWYPQLTFRNNIVRNNRARSILISTPRRVVVEGNSFSSMMAAILIEGDMNSWYESGAVRDVTIRNNRFLDGTYGGADFPTIFINPRQKKHVPGTPFERNIRIENNLFRTFNEQLLRANSVGGLIFRGNTIESSQSYKPYNDLPTISIQNSTEVVIEGNKYRKPGTMRVEQQ